MKIERINEEILSKREEEGESYDAGVEEDFINALKETICDLEERKIS